MNARVLADYILLLVLYKKMGLCRLVVGFGFTLF